jgi:hypothetical protein
VTFTFNPSNKSTEVIFANSPLGSYILCLRSFGFYFCIYVFNLNWSKQVPAATEQFLQIILFVVLSMKVSLEHLSKQ